MRLLPTLVALFAGLVLLGCTPSVLETHIRSANDVREWNTEAVGQLHARCPESDTSEGCALIRTVQHGFVDAHTQWVHELDADRDAGRWDDPQDGGVVRLVLLAYNQLRVEAEDRLGVVLPALPESFRRIAGVP